MNCKCGLECINFNGNYLCAKCNANEIRILSELYVEELLSDEYKEYDKE